MYRNTARKGLVALQKLEAKGLLPQTEELTTQSKIQPHKANSIIGTIVKELVRRDDVESLQWLIEGGYKVNIAKHIEKAPNSVNVKLFLVEQGLYSNKVWVEKQ